MHQAEASARLGLTLDLKRPFKPLRALLWDRTTECLERKEAVGGGTEDQDGCSRAARRPQVQGSVRGFRGCGVLRSRSLEVERVSIKVLSLGLLGRT